MKGSIPMDPSQYFFSFSSSLTSVLLSIVERLSRHSVTLLHDPYTVFFAVLLLVFLIINFSTSLKSDFEIVLFTFFVFFQPEDLTTD